MRRRGGHRQHVKRRRAVKVKTRKTAAANTSIDHRKKQLLCAHWRASVTKRLINRRQKARCSM